MGIFPRCGDVGGCPLTEPHYCDKHDVFECPDCHPPQKEARRRADS